jgi:uncharacterized repeat protein (TIGR01451 family)
MNRVRLIATCLLLIGGGLIVTAAPTQAAELGNKIVVRNTDFASFGVGGMRGTGSGSISVTGLSGSVTKALLYWHGPTNSSDPTANADVSFAGNPVTGTNIGISSDNCWGFVNSQSYRADVTNFVSGDGTYALDGFRKIDGTVIADVNGASLFVFFQDGDPSNNRDVTVVDGNDSNVSNTFDSDGWDATIPGIDYAGGTAHLQLHVADGQSYQDGAVNINDSQLLPAGQNFDGDSVPGTFPEGQDPNAPGITGNFWDIKTYDITGSMTAPSTSLHLTSPILNDCLSLVAASVDVPSAIADLAVTKTDSPDPVAGSTGNKVQYTITVSNNGPATATRAVLDDQIPAQLTSPSATTTMGSCTIASNHLNCVLGAMASGSTATVTVLATVPTLSSTDKPVTISNTATVQDTSSGSTPPTSDPQPANNSATEPTTIQAQSPTFNASFVAAGGTLTTQFANTCSDLSQTSVTPQVGGGVSVNEVDAPCPSAAVSAITVPATDVLPCPTSQNPNQKCYHISDVRAPASGHPPTPGTLAGRVVVVMRISTAIAGKNPGQTFIMAQDSPGHWINVPKCGTTFPDPCFLGKSLSSGPLQFTVYGSTVFDPAGHH